MDVEDLMEDAAAGLLSCFFFAAVVMAVASAVAVALVVTVEITAAALSSGF